MRLFLLLLSLVVVGCIGRKRGLTSISDPVPAFGDQRLLVITVQYPHLEGSYTGRQWNKNLFEEWVQFFKAQSYKKLRYTVDVITTNQDRPVVNDRFSTQYITLPHTINVYANGEHGWNFDSPYSLHTIVRDACEYLDARHFDWSPYVQNGTVQNVVIMSAGYDYRYAEKDKPNPKENYLLSTSFSGASYRTRNGFMLDSYTFCSEHTQGFKQRPPVMASLGQCAHEFGHALGIPDLYDLSDQTSGVGYFDMLGYGPYANDELDGSHPVGFGAWPKTTLGWAEPIVIRNQTIEVKLGPVSKSPKNLLKVYPSSSNDTYFLIENRQPLDEWDKNFANQYTNGIVIWAINESDCKQFTPYNSVNTHETDIYPFVPPQPAVVIMEADNIQDMSTISDSKKFGDADDVWQVGDQYILSDKFSIAIMSFSDQVYTIRISYNGSVPVDQMGVSSSLVVSSYFIFFFALASLLCNFLM